MAPFTSKSTDFYEIIRSKGAEQVRGTNRCVYAERERERDRESEREREQERENERERGQREREREREEGGEREERERERGREREIFEMRDVCQRVQFCDPFSLVAPVYR